MNYDEYYLHQDYDLGLYGDVIFVAKDYGDLTRPNVQKELKRTYELIKKINVTHNNRTYYYQDLCAKRNGKCVTEGDIFFQPSFWQRLLDGQFNQYMMTNFYTDDDGVPNSLAFIFGKNFVLNGSAGIFTTKVLKLRFNLRPTLPGHGNGTDVEAISRLWEQAFIEFFQDFHSISIRGIYTVSTSIDRELENNINLGKTSRTTLSMVTHASLDLKLVFATFSVMIVVATVLPVHTWPVVGITRPFVRRRCVGHDARSHLGLWLLLACRHTGMLVGLRHTFLSHR